ncbi:MAG: precorrin-6y C5,15-methyltransferase (decarboxylating) subunit CbiE [Candidatus Nezhaarchaeales archaeon]
MAKIYIVGAGPGDPDYVTPIARKMVRQAELVIGSERAVKLFNNDVRGEVIILDSRNFREVMVYAVERARSGANVVMVSTGDPGFAGLLGTFIKSFGTKLDVEVDVIPGVSVIQVCAAKLKICWDDAVLISLHEGATEEKRRRLAGAVKSGKTVILLPNTRSFTVRDVVKYLLSEGVDEETIAYVCEDLTLSSERIVKATLRELMSYEGSSLCVMVITPRRGNCVEL